MRRGGRALCGEDAYRADLAAIETRLSRHLDRIAVIGAAGGDPIELALRLLLVSQSEPKEASYPYFGTAREDDPVAAERRDRIAAALMAALPQQPAFRVHPATAHVECTDPGTVARWVANSGRLPVEDVPIRSEITFPWHRWRTHGYDRTVVLAPPRVEQNYDDRYARHVPARRLLMSGQVIDADDLSPGWETVRSPGSTTADMIEVARRLRLH